MSLPLLQVVPCAGLHVVGILLLQVVPFPGLHVVGLLLLQVVPFKGLHVVGLPLLQVVIIPGLFVVYAGGPSLLLRYSQSLDGILQLLRSGFIFLNQMVE